MSTGIVVYTKTNLDIHEQFPRQFTAVPRVGDLVVSDRHE